MRSHSFQTHRRSGVVLLVVLAMLALFASVALSFVFYADAEAISARLAADAQIPTQADVDPETLAAYFLSQLLYDTNNLQSAARGWSLGRGIYGFNPNTLNYIPYNGFNRTTALSKKDTDLGSLDQATNLVNYQTFWDPTQPPVNRTVNFLRTPEFYDKVFFGPAAYPFGIPDPTQYVSQYWPAKWVSTPPTPPTYGYRGGANPPYTTYGTNDIFLSQMKSDGTILMPSFYRPWTANAALSPFFGKYTSLFIDPTWNPQFYQFLPDADSQTGVQVRNLESGPGYTGTNVLTTIPFNAATAYVPGNVISTGVLTYVCVKATKGVPPPNPAFWAQVGTGPQRNDSNWMDFGFPVMTAPDGVTRYKALFSPLVVDLSNRLHLWAHGNRVGKGGTHVSNMGLGSTEVSLSRIAASVAELQAFFNYRYGGQAGNAKSKALGTPGAPVAGLPQGFNNLPFLPAQYRKGTWWSKMDGDGADFTAPGKANGLSTATAKIVLPPPGTILNFPQYPGGYGNLNDTGNELIDMPLALNPYNPKFPNPHILGPSNLEAIFRVTGTGSFAATSELMRTMPQTLKGSGNLVTLASFGLDRALSSTVIGNTPPGNYQFLPATSAPAQRFPYWNPTLGTPAPSPPLAAVPAANVPVGDFSSDSRSTLGNSLRVDLNRPLTDYATSAKQAILDRQAFARDIYFALLEATVGSPMTQNLANNFANGLPIGINPTNQAAISGARWLAQLAVNIVDYIDDDNNITPFHYNTKPIPSILPATTWVYGTELPGLVINEVYAQNDNDPNDPKIKTPVKVKGVPKPKASYYVLNVWAELLNPFDQASPGATPPDLARGTTNLANKGVPAYEVVVCQASQALSIQMRDPANNDGNANGNKVYTTASDWNPTSVPKQGFYVVGPKITFLPGSNPALPATHLSSSMTTPNGLLTVPNITVLLRRLACPTIAANANPNSPTYNPYITVDYLENIPAMNNLAFDNTGPVATPPVMSTFTSFGRKQPYTASGVPIPGVTTQVLAQAENTPRAGGAASPQTTLGQNNSILTFMLPQLPVAPPFVAPAPPAPPPASPFVKPPVTKRTAKPAQWTELYPAVGTGYNYWPTITLAGGGVGPAQQATAQAVMGIETYNQAPRAKPKNPLIADEGSGYVSPPTVTFSGGGAAAGAQATAIVLPSDIVAGKVTKIRMLTGGAYTSVPTIVLTGGGPGGGPPTTTAKAFVGTPGNALQSNYSVNIKSIKWAAGIVTVTATANFLGNTFVSGQAVDIVGVTPKGYDGPFKILTATNNTFTYALPANPGPEKKVGVPIASVTSNTFNLVGIKLTNNGANNITQNKRYTSPPVIAYSVPPALVGKYTTHGAGIAAVSALVETPNDWLFHLDRPPVNALELLYVSGFKPHELTQQFKTSNATGANIMPTVPILSATEAGKTVTITTTIPHGFSPGQSVFISGVSVPGYNSAPLGVGLAVPAYAITVLSTNSFSYQGNAAGYAPGAGGFTSGAAENGNIVSIATLTPHGLTAGQAAVVSGVSVAGYNGTFQVMTGTPGSYTFSYYTSNLDSSLANLAYSGNGAVYPWMSQAGIKQQHFAPWNPYWQLGNVAPGANMQKSSLYRALEAMSTSSHLAGEIPGGRRMGQINLNTLMDQVTFDSLCDAATPANQAIAPQIFDQGQVNNSWQNLVGIGKVTGARGFLNGTVPSTDPTPLQSFGSGDVTKTLFQNISGTTTGIFAVTSPAPPAHPYQQGALLQKIYNNITTTSNTFAVFWTVGYFQVVDESVRPPRLGEEIGRRQNRHIRHRFFAVLDRSAMELQRKLVTAAIPVQASKNQLGQFNQFTLTLTDPPGVSQPWLLQPAAPTANNPNPTLPVEIIAPVPNPFPLATATITAANPAARTITVTLNGPPGTTIQNALNAPNAPNGAAPWIVVLRGMPGPKENNLLPFMTFPAGGVGAGPNRVMNVTNLRGNLSNGQAWNIQPGMYLQVGRPGVNAEVVFVKSVAPAPLPGVGGSFTADFTLGHTPADPVVPWQQPGYNPHLDPAVLYMTVIK